MAQGISILGSTGSIGKTALRVLSWLGDDYQVVALAGGRNWEELVKQALEFKPRVVASPYPESAEKLSSELAVSGIRVAEGLAGLIEVATHPQADIVVSAIVGSAGLLPTMRAVQAGKRVALANKETLVMAGELIVQEAKRSGALITPVDSEHSAIAQCLAGHRREEVKRIILTASGGPFLGYSRTQLEKVSPEEALKHPNWNMGSKITIDSATLMNKGLEIIEAVWLFGMDIDNIEVVIHPQSLIHSMVEFADGSILAQLAVPDMALPLQYALTFPNRITSPVAPLDLLSIANLQFFSPDEATFPAIKLTRRAVEMGGTATAILNGANEVAVEAFLGGKISFNDITTTVQDTLDILGSSPANSLEEILASDAEARQVARGAIETLERDRAS
jgi:1-deoxy-D-xylulose-5-phosphate reductoisomerase